MIIPWRIGEIKKEELRPLKHPVKLGYLLQRKEVEI